MRCRASQDPKWQTIVRGPPNSSDWADNLELPRGSTHRLWQCSASPVHSGETAHLAGSKCHCLQGKWKWRNTLLSRSNIYPHHIAGHRASFRNTDEKSYPPFTGPLFIKHLLCAMHGSRSFDTAVNSCRSHVANILVEKDWWQPNKSVCQGVVRAMKKSQARSRIREW